MHVKKGQTGKAITPGFNKTAKNQQLVYNDQ